MKTDRIVVITGAGGGMGKLAVERFLANGDTVVTSDTAEESLAKLAPSDKLSTVVADISKEEDCAGVA